MRKPLLTRSFVPLLLLILLLLAACSGGAETPASESPTQEVEVKPTMAEPTEAPPTEVPPTKAANSGTGVSGAADLQMECTLVSDQPDVPAEYVAIFGVTEDDWVKGSETPAVTIVEYSDFQ